MVICLFITAAFITYVAYQNSKLRLLSPTFWVSGMFMAFSFIYSITICSMKSDISPLTLCIILMFLIVTAVGEFLANRIVIKSGKGESHKRIELIKESGPIKIDKWKVYLLTIIFLIVAVDRFRNLANLVGVNVSSMSSLMSMMSNARMLFVNSNRSVVLSSTLFNQLIYLCEAVTYIMIYVFLYNLIIYKKKQYYLLLILVPDLIIRFLSTSRTSFFVLIVATMTSYFAILLRENRLKRLHISYKLFLGIGAFIVVFIVYGRVRNEAQSIPIVNYVQMYSCSSLFGLDSLLTNGWSKNPYFGFNTLGNIYDLLGIEHSTVRTWGSMVVFSKNNYHANLYTSLANPIIDYGTFGMLILRLVASIMATKIITAFIKKTHSSSGFYVSLYFASVMIYCYFYAATGDVFADYFLNPGLMIRYLLYTWICVKFFLKPRVVYSKVNGG